MKLCIFTSWLCINAKEILIKLTTRYACKVVDLLIQLIDWPFCASPNMQIIAGRTVQHVDYLVVFYVLRMPVYIWNRIARCTHFILFFGHPWKFLKAHYSIMSPNFGVKHDTQVKNTAKYPKYSRRERGYFIRDISYHRLIKHKQALNLPMYRPFYMNVFFFNISLPGGGGGHCEASTEP